MSVDASTPVLPSGPDQKSEAAASTQLRGRALTLARALWIILAGLALGLYLSAVPIRFNQLVTVTPLGDNALAQLSTEEALALQQHGYSVTLYALYFIALEVSFVLVFAGIGLWIFGRRSDEWFAMFVALTLVTFGVLVPATLRALAPEAAVLQLPVHIVQVVGWSTFFTLFYLFPDGRFVPRVTRFIPIFFFAWGLAWVLFPFADAFNWPLPLALLAFFALFTIGMFAQLYRYVRVSTPTQRLQTRWVVFGFAVAALGTMVFAAPSVLFPQLNLPGLGRVVYHVIGIPVFALALVFIPITLDIAIRRHRLWEIDPIINRTLVYGLLTAILAGLYAACITLSQKIFIAITGEGSDAAIVLTTLILVSVFTPLKNRLEALVETRFQYPAKRLSELTDQVLSFIRMHDVEQLTSRFLVEAVATYGAESGAVFLIKQGREQLIHACGAWNGDSLLNVPLESAGTHIGRIALGQRIHNAPYSTEDRARLQRAALLVARAIELAQRTDGGHV